MKLQDIPVDEWHLFKRKCPNVRKVFNSYADEINEKNKKLDNIMLNLHKWIQWNALNGSTCTWGSDEILRFNHELTVKDFEDLAKELQGSNND